MSKRKTVADEIERLRAELGAVQAESRYFKRLATEYESCGNTALADRDRLRAALASVVKHWREFGPEHGFDETLERAALAGGAEPKHAPHCSSIPDASGPAQQCDCGAEPKYPHADEPVMWFDRDRETRAESPAKPQATLGTARHFCLACTRAFGCLPGECTAEPASEPHATEWALRTALDECAQEFLRIGRAFDWQDSRRRDLFELAEKYGRIADGRDGPPVTRAAGNSAGGL